MRALNWVGIVMLFLALIFNELFLGINAWYELNTGAIIAAIIYLIAGVTLSLWPTPSDDQA
ncbi:MAG: hypothetical protein NNA23_11775 [Nitrospira sp.]|nr:hypothetical protein [Nitrospira sp.]MCP9463861.1 hypothetical protein [Nitrospira sp.]